MIRLTAENRFAVIISVQMIILDGLNCVSKTGCKEL